jgi:taurine dioxygenase
MQITPLAQGFGARISDFDVVRGGSPEDIAALKRAYDEWHLLIFEAGGPVSPERQLEITGWFGPVLIDGAAWSTLDNAEPAGRNILPFHSDIAWLEYPLEGISLYPQALPATDTSTSFISTAAGWQALPAALQREVQGRRARHWDDVGRAMGMDWPDFEFWHPICMPHPNTGRTLLFVNENDTDRIEGVDAARSAEILQAMFAALYAPERRYEHVWRQGDLLVWNNFAVQHARTRIADPADGPRIMRRVQLGKYGFMEQAERVRQRQAQFAPAAS